VTGYHLEVAAVDHLSGDQAWERKYSGAHTQAEVAGLVPFTEYAFRVKVRGEIAG
jgi:hypothetical protein